MSVCSEDDSDCTKSKTWRLKRFPNPNYSEDLFCYRLLRFLPYNQSNVTSPSSPTILTTVLLYASLSFYHLLQPFSSPLIQSKSLFSIWVFLFFFHWQFAHIYISLCVSLSHGYSLVCHISAVHVAWACLHVGHVRRGPIHVSFHVGFLLVHAQQQATLWQQMGSEEEEDVLV